MTLCDRTYRSNFSRFLVGKEQGLATSGQGRLFVLSGPSGVGKDSVLTAMFENMSHIVRSVSATTRPPRAGEVDGKDYHFLTRQEFEAGIATGVYLEHALYAGSYYGTPLEGVQSQRLSGNDVILKIEVQGANRVREVAPDAILIFIEPPSLQVLESRLRLRGTDDEARVRARLQRAKEELECVPWYDYRIVNDDLSSAVDSLRAIVLAERCRIRV